MRGNYLGLIVKKCIKSHTGLSPRITVRTNKVSVYIHVHFIHILDHMMNVSVHVCNQSSVHGGFMG